MIKGFCLGRFDLLHHGHIELFKKAKENCDFFVIGLMENSFKAFRKKPIIFSLEQRRSILESIKYIDQIVEFKEESEVYKWLEENKPDILFAGEDYKRNQPLGKYFGENIIYIRRISSSEEIKKKIAKTIKDNNNP